MIRAVIFDLDGLLIDTEPLWQKAEIKAFATVGVILTREMTLQTTGLRVDQVVAYWFERYPWENKSGKEVSNLIESEVIKLIKNEGKAKPGVDHIINIVKDAGLQIALASSSHYAVINAALQRLRLVDLIKVIHSAEEEQFGKPHPAVYLTTAKKLGVEPESCLALEDSLNGVKSAKAAGMKCIAVPDLRFNITEQFKNLADKVVTSLQQIDKKMIQNLYTSGLNTH